jgi:hypothetical protein
MNFCTVKPLKRILVVLGDSRELLRPINNDALARCMAPKGSSYFIAPQLRESL